MLLKILSWLLLLEPFRAQLFIKALQLKSGEIRFFAVKKVAHVVKQNLVKLVDFVSYTCYNVGSVWKIIF